MKHDHRVPSVGLRTRAWFFGVALLGLVFAGYITQVGAAGASVPCHTTTKIATTTSKYGSPIDFFNTMKPFMTVTCDEKNTTAYIGTGSDTQYIYKLGYQYVGGAWKKVTLTGSNQAGSWIIGKASASVVPAAKGKEGKILAYTCQRISTGEWKCGCADSSCRSPKWQLQTYQSYAEAAQGAGVGDGFVEVYYPSTYNARPGERVQINGAGFEVKPTHTVRWNGTVTEQGISSQDENTLAVHVPNLPPGKYEVEISEETTSGESDTEHNTTVIWIGTGATQKPVIEKITPSQAKQGDTVTVYGTGFTPENNDVISTFGVISGLKSKDGKTISFTYDPFPTKAKFYNEDGSALPVVWDIHLTVFNTSGTSNSKSFKLNL